MLCFILHARLRVHQASDIPCALFIEGAKEFLQNSGAWRGENAEACPPPSCSANAGHPVRRGFSLQSLASLEYWVARSSRASRRWPGRHRAGFTRGFIRYANSVRSPVGMNTSSEARAILSRPQDQDRPLQSTPPSRGLPSSVRPEHWAEPRRGPCKPSGFSSRKDPSCGHPPSAASRTGSRRRR
jgi:hypothetical protein